MTDQTRRFGEVIRYLQNIMKTAHVMHAEDLKNKPIEMETEGNRLVSWRILEEVL